MALNLRNECQERFIEMPVCKLIYVNNVFVKQLVPAALCILGSLYRAALQL